LLAAFSTSLSKQ